MNVLFLSLIKISSLEEHGIYQDLLREFVRNGHKVFIISPSERRYGEDTHKKVFTNYEILHVKTGNIQKTNVIEKGFATLLIETQIISAIKKYYSDIKFDLILYATPPITFVKVIEYVKKRDKARTYLMLKDIFPQNAVDLGMLSKSGIKGVLYQYFKRKEGKLYATSDRIGCMSQANVDYLLEHNPQIDPSIVEVCPNSIEVMDVTLTEEERISMRYKYDIPLDKKVFVYGGNLGKPQGIDFIIECLKTQEQNDKVFFLIVGDGTEFQKLQNYLNQAKPTNVKLMQSLPKDDYDRMIASCDIGMIFLDHRFTIPNFPSRLLSYMQAGLPVLACTDKNTDIGKVIVEGKFGWWCESNNIRAFQNKIDKIGLNEMVIYKDNAYKYLLCHYNVRITYNYLINKIGL